MLISTQKKIRDAVLKKCSTIPQRYKDLLVYRAVRKVYLTVMNPLSKWMDPRNYDLVIRYNFKRNQLRIKTYDMPKWRIDRNYKNLVLFSEAIEQARPKLRKSFTIKVCCRDVCEVKREQCFAYCKKPEQKNITLIPDYSFTNWKEFRIPYYDDLCSAMMEGAKLPPEYDTLFWIGTVNSHYTRQILCDVAKQDNRMEVYGMDWHHVGDQKNPSKYVSLPDHTKYKYLLDIQGWAWSTREKILMFSGRPLFRVDRAWEEFWTKDTEPFVHYIPVKEDLSDLKEKLDWAEANPEKAQKIAENALEFAKTHLTHRAAVDYLSNLLIERYGA